MTAIPAHAGQRTYFVFAEVEPKEAVSFGLTNGIEFERSASRVETLEVIGHMLVWWRTAEVEQPLNVLLAQAQDLFDVTLALHALFRIHAGDARRGFARRAV